jgi:hypothetical protein
MTSSMLNGFSAMTDKCSGLVCLCRNPHDLIQPPSDQRNVLRTSVPSYMVGLGCYLARKKLNDELNVGKCHPGQEGTLAREYGATLGDSSVRHCRRPVTSATHAGA